MVGVVGSCHVHLLVVTLSFFSLFLVVVNGSRCQDLCFCMHVLDVRAVGPVDGVVGSTSFGLAMCVDVTSSSHDRVVAQSVSTEHIVGVRLHGRRRAPRRARGWAVVSLCFFYSDVFVAWAACADDVVDGDMGFSSSMVSDGLDPYYGRSVIGIIGIYFCLCFAVFM